MSESKKIIPMNVWAILNPERYIKKSIKDWSLAIYDEKGSADRQVKCISRANNEECFIEEFSLCNKTKLDEYIKVHNEMYEMLVTLSGMMPMLDEQTHPSIEMDDIKHDIDKLLAKVLGEQ